MGSLYQINVTELEDIIGGAEYGGSVQPPAGYTGYAVVDSGSNIRSAPTSDLQLFYVYEYEFEPRTARLHRSTSGHARL